MLRIRDLAVVCVVVCLTLGIAARSEASFITAPDFVVTQAPDGFSFDGHFNQDNDVALIEFSIDFQSTFQVLVTSFNELNGFNPNLFLLNTDGTQAEGLDAEGTPIEVNNQDAGNSPLIATIAKGSYVLAITQQFNLPNITSPGFSMDDSPFYTCDFLEASTGCTGFIDPFVDTFPTPRSNRVAGSVAITSLEQPAPVPEPGTLTLLAGGLGALAARRRRRRASNEQRVLPVVTLGQSRR